MRILYLDNHVLAVLKPRNMPVQPDASGDEDLQSALKCYLKQTYQKPGNVYLGIVHRLDRPTGGVMVFARTSKAAARLSGQFRARTVQRCYYAVVWDCRTPVGVHVELEDSLVQHKDRVRVAEAEEPGAKLARLGYQKLEERRRLSLLNITLHSGRKHQIRVQLSARAMPIWGDMRYGKQEKGHIALFAHTLCIDHPTTKERLTFTAGPQGYPFSLFAGRGN
ncbi:MAG: RluA family pseudouridine synthase [Christensenellales bacterium]|jgi:23S rRNA pseudouridine1911/1915/1917 synthase